MIVRISGEGQYVLADDDSARLNELENAVVSAVEANDEQRYASAFPALLDYVRSNGTEVAEGDLETSDVIIPPSDISLQEAAADFTGEGLIPD